MKPLVLFLQDALMWTSFYHDIDFQRVMATVTTDLSAVLNQSGNIGAHSAQKQRVSSLTKKKRRHSSPLNKCVFEYNTHVYV